MKYGDNFRELLNFSDSGKEFCEKEEKENFNQSSGIASRFTLFAASSSFTTSNGACGLQRTAARSRFLSPSYHQN